MSGEFFPKPFSPAETAALEREIRPKGQAVNDTHECIPALIFCLKSVVSDNSSTLIPSSIATSVEPAKKDFCPRIKFMSECKI